MIKKILLVHSKVDPVFAVLRKELVEAGIDVLSLNTREGKVSGSLSDSVPPWVGGTDGLLTTKWFQNLLRKGGIQLTISIGLDALLDMSSVLDIGRVISVLEPGDMDMSSRRAKRIRKFVGLTKSVEALVFFNEYEMLKASSLGSCAPHFLWDLSSLPFEHRLTGDAAGVTALVVSNHSYRRGRDEVFSELRQRGLNIEDIRGQVEVVSAESLFWHQDEVLGRRFENTVRFRFGKYSRAVFLDQDASSQIGMAIFRGSVGGAILASSSIEGHLLKKQNSDLSVAAEPRMISLLNQLPISNGVSLSQERTRVKGRSVREIVKTTMREVSQLPWFYEDIGDIQTLNVFVSVAAIENRSNGARPQRIRNMYLAMDETDNTYPIHLNKQCLRRRSQMLMYAVGKGVRCEFLYGENSTTPVDSLDVLLEFTRMVDWLQSHGGTKTSWFVRDVHWLDPNLQAGRRTAVRSMIRKGEIELRMVQQTFGAVLSPSPQSSQMYSELAEPFFPLSFSEAALPPGVCIDNVAVNSQLADSDDAVTFVYTGGIGALYSMDAYLDALASVIQRYPTKVKADFIVRTSEDKELRNSLQARGLHAGGPIRIINGDFSSYQPSTSRAVGVLLLESGYGRRAFAFKSMSYIEKNMPFLCYVGSPNFEYLEHHGVCIPVDGDSGIEVALETGMFEDFSAIDWSGVVAAESWKARWETVREVSSNNVREMI